MHMASVWVPFTSESKEAVAHYPEIIKEMKLAISKKDFERLYSDLGVIRRAPSDPRCDGILKSAKPFGPNRVSCHEERVQTTYNIASKVNGLLHCGVGDLFHNGFRGASLARRSRRQPGQ